MAITYDPELAIVPTNLLSGTEVGVGDFYEDDEVEGHVKIVGASGIEICSSRDIDFCPECSKERTCPISLARRP